jgi:hypothetical protein
MDDIQQVRADVLGLIRQICIDSSFSSSGSSICSLQLSSCGSDSLSLPEALLQTPRNFLVPSFDRCVQASITVRCGRNYWPDDNMPRSTFLTVKLHPRLPVLKSTVEMYSLAPVYDLSAIVPVVDVSLNPIVPVIEVRDFAGGAQARPYGVAYLPTQGTVRRGGDIVVFHDEWVPVVSPISRVRCGELLVSYALHEADAGEQIAGRGRIIAHDDGPVILINASAQTGGTFLADEMTQTDIEADEQKTEFPRFLEDEKAATGNGDGFNIDDSLGESDDEMGTIRMAPFVIKPLDDGPGIDCPTRLREKYVRYVDYDWHCALSAATKSDINML